MKKFVYIGKELFFILLVNFFYLSFKSSKVKSSLLLFRIVIVIEAVVVVEMAAFIKINN